MSNFSSVSRHNITDILLNVTLTEISLNMTLSNQVFLLQVLIGGFPTMFNLLQGQCVLPYGCSKHFHPVSWSLILHSVCDCTLC